MTVSIQGQINQCGPNIAGGYTPGDIAQLYVECAIQGSKSWYDITGSRPILYSIDSLGISNQQIASMSFKYPWTTYQEWKITKTITIGPMTAEDINGTFVLLLGQEIVPLGQVSQSLLDLPTPTVLDSKDFTIPVKTTGASQIPWKQIGIGLGIVGVVSLVVAIARR